MMAFILLSLAPGDYFDEMRLDPRVSPQTVQDLRSRAGESRPLVTRYGRWLRSVVRGDWGFSLLYNVPASVVLYPRLLNTLVLTVSGLVLSWCLSLVLGLGSALLDSSSVRRSLKVVNALLLAIPDVLLAFVLLLLALRNGEFPAPGVVANQPLFSATDAFQNFSYHFALPVGCLTLSTLPVFLAHIQKTLHETALQPFARAAQSYGIPRVRIVLRHLLPASANPLVSLAGLSFGNLLSSSLIVEVVFGLPGLGKLLLESVLQRDAYLVVDIAVLSSLFLVIGNFCADILLYALDPRIRRQ